MLITEIKRVIKSLIYWIVVVLICIQWYQNYYGIATEEISIASDANLQSNEQIAPGIETQSVLKRPENSNKYEQPEEYTSKMIVGAIDQLLMEYKNNQYTTYPLGYYKAITLDEKGQRDILNVLCEVTGLNEEQLNNLPEEFFPACNGKIIHPKGYVEDDKITDKTQRFQSQVSFREFEQLMEHVCSIIGDGSDYSLQRIETNFGSGQTYTEAENDYDNTIIKDRVTGGFARYFCDVLSTVVSLLPMFLAVYFWLLDQKSGLRESLYAKSISSSRIIVTRVLAMVSLILIPIMLLSFEALIPLWKFGTVQGYSVDTIAFIKYILWWLMPTILLTISMSTFLTILTEAPIAIAVQGLWWFLGNGTARLIGDTKWYSLVIRHNSLQEYNGYENSISNIWINRSVISLLSLVLIFVSVYILDLKRKGRWDIRRVYGRFIHIDKRKY